MEKPLACYQMLGNQRASFQPCPKMTNLSMHALWGYLAFVDLKTIANGYLRMSLGLQGDQTNQS